MLEDLKLPTLQQQRLEPRLVMLYKVVRDTVPAINADEFLIMPPTLKKLMGHIAFGACVRGCMGGSHFLYLL